MSLHRLREDTGSRTEADAGAFERRFGQDDYEDDHRPTRAELDRDENEDEDPGACPGCGENAGHRGVCR